MISIRNGSYFRIMKIPRKIHSQSLCETPQPTKIMTDMIGPPDPISNLRQIVHKQNFNETQLEKKLREKRIEVHEWNQHFWHEHNSRFFKERENFLKKNLPEGKQTLSADEMSIFYKKFLDENWKSHVNYNMEWYKKNIYLLGLTIKVKLENLFKR